MASQNFYRTAIKEYIKQHFVDIVKNESIIEKRLSTDIVVDEMIKSNRYNL
mgnify:CR=1 FL=1